MDGKKLVVYILGFSFMSIMFTAYLNYNFHSNRVIGTQVQLKNCLDILESTPKNTVVQCNDNIGLCTTVTYGKSYDNQLIECQRINEKLDRYYRNLESLPQGKLFR